MELNRDSLFYCRDQPNLPGLRPPHLGSHHSSTVQAATLKRSSSAPASLLTSHLHAITMRATVSPLLPEDRPSHKAKTGFLGLRDINADGGIPARHASAVHAVQEQLLPFVKPSEGDTDAALSDSSAQDALGKSNQTGTLCSSTPDSLSQNSHRTVCDIGTAVADVSRDTGSKACANSGSSTEASNTSVALDAVTGQMCKASSTAPSGSDSNNVRSSFAVAAHSAPSQPMSSATAAAATVASDEVVEKATAQQGRLHESVTAAFAAEGNAGKSIAATAALAEGACGHAAQDRLTFVSPFQHASMQHVPTIPPSSASSMAVSDDELAHDEHSSAERFTAAVRTTRVLPDQDEIAHDTPSSSQKPTAAVRTVTVLPDQDDALGCALAAEQSFLSMGAGSLCGGSEFSASEDYGGLVCFNEGVQVAPPPLDDAVEEGPCGMYRPQQSGGFHPQQDVQSSLQYPKGDMQRAGSHFEPSSSGPSREGYPPFGPNSLLGYHEREWLQSMEDSEAVSQHSQSGQQRPMSCDEAQWQQSLETRSASSQQQQPQGMMHAPGDDSTNPHAGTPDAHLNESAESHAGMSGEYARISLDGAGHENWKFCLRRRVQQGPSGRHGTVVDDRAHSVDVTVSSRKLHRAAMSGVCCLIAQFANAPLWLPQCQPYVCQQTLS